MERMKPETDAMHIVKVTVGEPLGAGAGDITSTATLEETQEIADTVASRYMVKVHQGACGVCGDGRGCRHTLAETAPEPGPSVFGGPSITAYAAAELVGGYFGTQSGATSLERMNEVNDTLVAGGIVLGGHVSDGAVAKTNKTFINPETGKPETGCGANDKFLAIIGQTFANKEFVSDTTKALLGEDSFNLEYMNFDAKNQTADYDPRDALNAVASQAEGANIEVLEGKHAEQLVLFNYNRGYTVDRDAFVRENDGKQIFVVDMWYIDDIARAMSQGRPDAEEMYGKLRHAMVAFQVGTYLALCDGTHRPVILRPQEQEAAVPAAL